MVPINFWQNSDLFKKKEHFLAQKMKKLEHFNEISEIFKENNSTLKQNLLNVSRVTSMTIFSITRLGSSVSNSNKTLNFGSFVQIFRPE